MSYKSIGILLPKVRVTFSTANANAAPQSDVRIEPPTFGTAFVDLPVVMADHYAGDDCLEFSGALFQFISDAGVFALRLDCSDGCGDGIAG